MPINRNTLKKYAPKARRDFISAVTARAAKFGISDGDAVPMQEQGDVVIIGGEAFSKNVGAQRKALLGQVHLHGFGQTMEEVAYTWFNRFLAIRFMELHGYRRPLLSESNASWMRDPRHYFGRNLRGRP